MEIYEQSTLTVSASAEDIEIRIRDSISLSPEELVQELMADVCGHAHTNNSSIIQEEDARLYAAFQQMRPDLIPILHELAQTENSSHPCFTLLVCVIDTFTVLAGQLFPEAAKTLPDVELMFTSKREEQLLEFVQDWSEKCYDLTSVLSMTEESRRAVFVMLEMFLFLKWSRASSETDVPPIIFPSGNLVSKYAQPVVYYTAGWVLSRLVLAKTVAEHMRRPYQLFAMHHSITKEESRGAGLPTDLTDQREKKSLVRSSAEFFAIIQSIESVFLANLNLKMMLAFTDGSLCDEIRRGILNNELIVKIFFGLCDEVVEMPLDEGIRRDVLGFVMKRYVNMRGRWFIKIMKGQRKIDQGDAVMKDGATRTRVAAAAACSKAKGTASKEPNERKAYMEAKNNVVNAAVDTDTDDESDDNGI
jgi:hypothetical protein